MEECYYSHYFLWHYFQLTKSGYYQIIRKRKGQWKIVYKKKVSVDPVKYCETYKTCGCSHVDGYLCNMDSCHFKNKDSVLYSEIESLIIKWNNDGTKTAGSLTREIINLLKK